MDHLRSKLIKLAHTNPSLRGDLLPLLKKGGEEVPSLVSQALKNLDAAWSFVNKASFITVDGELMRELAKVRDGIHKLQNQLWSIEEGLGPRGTYLRGRR